MFQRTSQLLRTQVHFNKPARIATLALGYADGYPRPFSANAKVIVNGVVCPIAGNICMDQCMVDVSAVPNVKVGDEVIVMGSDGRKLSYS